MGEKKRFFEEVINQFKELGAEIADFWSSKSPSFEIPTEKIDLVEAMKKYQEERERNTAD